MVAKAAYQLASEPERTCKGAKQRLLIPNNTSHLPQDVFSSSEKRGTETGHVSDPSLVGQTFVEIREDVAAALLYAREGVQIEQRRFVSRHGE